MDSPPTSNLHGGHDTPKITTKIFNHVAVGLGIDYVRVRDLQKRIPHNTNPNVRLTANFPILSV